ncbi:class I adenylate-forming enzyme family protein [Georgenia sp. Z1491]|uniref:class I adenylate-forming enzyme family protein n=1 Tax=Georgenia sp. Z1491 TaxID=3416707 RepID=UPI003CFACDE3
MTLPSDNLGTAVSTDHPGAEALVEIQGGRATRWTYADLETAIEAQADRFAADGHAPGARIAILGKNSGAWLVAFYAAQRAGLVPVPVSHRLPADGIRYVLENSGARLLLAEDPAVVTGVPAGVTLAPLAGVLDGAEPSGRTAPVTRAARRSVDVDEPGMILYTSGSTGRPKGVVLSHASHLWVIGVGMGSGGGAGGDRALVAAPLYHMNALANVQGAFAAGGTVVLLEAFDARAFLQVTADERVTRVTGVPPMFALLLRERDLVESLDLGSVRFAFVGSAPASDDLLDEIGALFPRAHVRFGYGTTESGPVAFVEDLARPTPKGSVGLASPDVELRLVGADGEIDPRRGVLEIRVPALMSGYHDRPDVPSPLTADGFYHSKDLFEVDDDGYYFFAGREDDMFSSGGENVYPLAVEQVLQAYPGVLHAAVVPVPDEIKGAKPVAFVVLTEGASVTEDELRRHTLDHLEPYAHPRRVHVIDELPLSGTNKVDRHLLERLALERAAGPNDHAGSPDDPAAERFAPSAGASTSAPAEGPDL